jgi:hypothetical protein
MSQLRVISDDAGNTDFGMHHLHLLKNRDSKPRVHTLDSLMGSLPEEEHQMRVEVLLFPADPCYLIVENGNYYPITREAAVAIQAHLFSETMRLKRSRTHG